MTYDHRTDPRTLKQYEAAEVLGGLVGDGLLSQEEAQLTLALVVKLATEKAPDLHAPSLRSRLVHTAADARTAAYYARIRRERQQERVLADVAAEGFARRAPEQAIRAVVARTAKEIGAPASVVDGAVSLGRFRQRNGLWTST